MSDDLIVHEKFLFRASRKELENVLSLPLLHLVHSTFEKCEIDVIIDEDVFNPFASLPFPVRCFLLPKEKSSIAGVHHYAYNLKEVFNVDFFIDLGGGIKEAVLGLSFKAKKRIGFARGLQKLLLTHRIELKTEVKSDADFMRFAPCLFEDAEMPELLKVCGVVQVKHPHPGDPFLFVLIDKLFLEDEKNRLWLDFFDSLVGERIALFVKEVEIDPNAPTVDDDGNEIDRVVEFKKHFVEKLDQRNKYIHIPQFDHAVFRTLTSACLALVTDVPWVAVLGSYYLKQSFCLIQSDRIVPLEYFEQIPRWVYIKDSIPYKIIGAFENSDLSDMSELVDYIFKKEESIEENEAD